MAITFAGIPWRSSTNEATALLQTRGFSVIEGDSGSLLAGGTIFGKEVGAVLTFNTLGLYDVGVVITIDPSRVLDEYNLILELLLEKYGRPSFGNDKGARWQSSETTGVSEVSISLPKGQGPLVILYKSPECRQAIQDELEQIIRESDGGRGDALDLL